ncbi:hypothetical protein CP8484711_0006A, partial [Chlamydia psittaci 84-8471/1]
MSLKISISSKIRSD